MKLCCKLACMFSAVLFIGAAIVQAETRYISDQLIVSLREQPQNNATPITYLKTDTPVEVLAEKGDFLEVKTETGQIGYIKQNYLAKAPPKTFQIARLEKERDQLLKQVVSLKQQLLDATATDGRQQALSKEVTDTQNRMDELKKAYDESQASLIQVNQDYETFKKNAKNVVALTEERDHLLEKNQLLQSTIISLEEERDSLMKTGIIKWFLAGAGVLFFGWLIGKISNTRRRSMF